MYHDFVNLKILWPHFECKLFLKKDLLHELDRYGGLSRVCG